MSGGAVRLVDEGPIARIVFDRPEAMNAMTEAMYEMLEGICRRLADPGARRDVVLRGAGGRAFVAGSDIAECARFEGGLVCERKMDRILDALSAMPVPTISVIDGLAVGDGLNIAGHGDLRVTTNGRVLRCRSRARRETACRWQAMHVWPARWPTATRAGC